MVIYWITDLIGTASAIELHSWPIDSAPINLLDLEDGWNEPFRIYMRLKESLGILAQGKRLIFVCLAGISRSNAFATTMIAYLEDIDWDDAYNLVRKKCPRAQINMKLRDSCLEALQMMKDLLTKDCPKCKMVIENWETLCNKCWRERNGEKAI